MKKTTFLIFVPVTALLSCTKNYIIPERDMVKILTKIFITDGVTSTPPHNILYGHDTIDYYEPILKSYGYTTAQFDSSVKYYSRNTEKFDIIFDKVVMELTRMKDKLEEASKNDTLDINSDSSGNLWPHKTRWNMAIDYSINPSLGFDIPVVEFGDYTISFDAQFFPDDEGVNVRHYIFFYFDDGTPIGVRENPIFATYPKDGNVHSYSYKLTLTNNQITHLKGWLYDCGNSNSTFKRNAIFNNIKVTYSPKKIDHLDTLGTRNIRELKKPLKRVKPV
ncbi:MAG TPA: DUF4296 domain-containing protein [Bacteroidales bacterium]|nr:DUF4296 domain-containing protein [Bacteroidales bacterium]